MPKATNKWTLFTYHVKESLWYHDFADRNERWIGRL